MGVGSLATKRLTGFAAVSFALIEAALGIIGGLSVILLYLAFAFADVYTVAMVALAFVIGALIGAEIPLLMELVQRIRRRRPERGGRPLRRRLCGRLIGGLAFPFLLLPRRDCRVPGSGDDECGGHPHRHSSALFSRAAPIAE